MTQQEQMKLVLLYSLNELGGGEQRKHVLQYINDHNYWYKNDQNDVLRATRNEIAWRNDFSFERQHLVEHGFMKKNGNGRWEITEAGIIELDLLLEKCRNIKQNEYHCFTLDFFKKLYSIQNFNESAEDQQLIEEISQMVCNPTDTQLNLVNAPMPKGQKLQSGDKKNVYKRDPKVSKRALSRAGHVCEIDSTHKSFLRRNSNNLYMEPHHLVPMSFTDYFGVNLDREQNIFSLCSHCHNQIHYGTKEDVRTLITQLFLSRQYEICSILGRDINLDELFQIYNVK